MTTEQIIEKSKLDWYRDNNKILYSMLKDKDEKIIALTKENNNLKSQLYELKRLKAIL